MVLLKAVTEIVTLPNPDGLPFANGVAKDKGIVEGHAWLFGQAEPASPKLRHTQASGKGIEKPAERVDSAI
jgi:hypothetical protein